MKHALYRIDNLKIVFVDHNFQNTSRDANDKNKTHFNIFKFYIMTHYIIFIRLYNSAQSFDII